MIILKSFNNVVKKEIHVCNIYYYKKWEYLVKNLTSNKNNKINIKKKSTL